MTIRKEPYQIPMSRERGPYVDDMNPLRPRVNDIPPLAAERARDRGEESVKPAEPLQQPEQPGTHQQVKDHVTVALERLCAALLACENGDVVERLLVAIDYTKTVDLVLRRVAKTE